MAPVAVKDSASEDFRCGRIAASEPWLMSITMWPSASRPSSRMSGFARSAGTETGAGRETAAARESRAMRPCYTNPQIPNASSPVMSRPMISVWMSCVPS
jgi:hypothetical protein